MKFNFLYADMRLGGAVTLTLRICKALNEEHIVTNIFCCMMDEELKSNFESVGTEVIRDEKYDVRKYCAETAGATNIFFFMPDFFAMEIVNKKKKAGMKNLFYIVHPYALHLPGETNHAYISKVGKLFCRKCMQDYLCSGKIIFMDKECVKKAQSIYKVNIPNALEKILRIPIDTDNLGTKVHHKRRNVVLTVARADFPLKGYLKGLIETCCKMKEEGLHLELRIVSYGSGEDVLKTWIDQTRFSNDCIKYLGKIAYDNLMEEYQNADFYVGMGTTVLEAARAHLIPIVANSYTYEFMTEGIFGHDHIEVGTISTDILQEDALKYKKGEDVLREMILMSDEEVYGLGKEAYTALMQNYTIENCMNKLKTWGVDVRCDRVPLYWKAITCIMNKMM